MSKMIPGAEGGHVFEQVVEYSWAGDVSVAGNQPDGVGDVSLGAQCRAIDADRVRRYGT